MKLGYYYMVTAGGAGSKEVIVNGEGQWTSVVDDERRIWQKYAENGHCLAMTFTNDGLVLVFTKILGGSRPDNNVSTWIYIPSKIKITGVQLEEIVSEIQNLYSNGTKDITEESFRSNNVLGQDFAEKRYGPEVSPSIGDLYAYRSNNSDWTLKEVLDNPFQDYYSKYKFIFLFKEDPIVKDGLTNLSSKDIEDMQIVLPPSTNSIRTLFDSESINIYLNNKEFISPVSQKKGSLLKLTAHRTGYLPIDFYAQVEADEQEAKYLTEKIVWRKIISGDMIKARDEKSGIELKSANLLIHILDSEWDSNTKSLPQNRLKDVPIRISYPGYESLERRVDFTRPITTIDLRKMEEKKEYSYQTKDGRRLKITIVGEGAKSTSPIDGYTASNDRLFYKGEKFIHENSTSSQGARGIKHQRKTKLNIVWNSWVVYVLIVLAAILLSAGIWVYTSGNFTNLFTKPSSTEDTNNTDSLTNEDQNDQYYQVDNVDEIQDQNIEKAKEYISNCNGKLRKGALDLNPETVGLFEAINEFKLEELVSSWNEKFGELNEFKPIVKAAQACINNNYDPTQQGNRPKYNKIESDTIIIIKGWTYWVDKECTKNPNSTSMPQTKQINDDLNKEESHRGNDW